MCHYEINRSVFVAEISVSYFNRESLEWNSISEIYVWHLLVMLEMLHD